MIAFHPVIRKAERGDLPTTMHPALQRAQLHIRKSIRIHSLQLAKDRFGGAFGVGSQTGRDKLPHIGEGLEAFLRDHKAALKTPRGELLAASGIVLGRTPDQEKRGGEWHQRQVDLYGQVQAAKTHGLHLTAIAKLLGMSRPTASRYGSMTAPPERLRRPSGVLRPGAAYVPSMYQRWNDGCRNGSQIHRELTQQGMRLSLRTVTRYLTILRRENGAGRSFATVEPSSRYIPHDPPTPLLTLRQGATLFGKETDKLTAQERRYLNQILTRDDTLRPVYDLVQVFRRMMRMREGNELETWLEQAEHVACPQLQAFAAGLRKDFAAVKAGLTKEYSQGPVEGHVHRVKCIKRSGYGRMGFPLLRQRVLVAQAS